MKRDFFKNDFIMLSSPEKSDDRAIFNLCSDPVICRLPYTMPYDNFDGIRNIQLAVRKHDLFETPPVIVAVDLSEWLGHEQDEYFISTIRFCCDHSNWKYIFTIRGEFGRRAKDMYQLISSYMKGRLITADPPAPFDDIKPFIKEVI